MVFLLYPSAAFGLRQRPLFFDWFRPSLDKPISGAVQFRCLPKDTNEYLEKKGVKKSVNIGNWWNTFIHLSESQSNWKKKAMAIWPLKWKGQWSGKFEILLLPKWEPRCCWSKEREDWVPPTYFRTLQYFNTLFVISLNTFEGKIAISKKKEVCVLYQNGKLSEIDNSGRACKCIIGSRRTFRHNIKVLEVQFLI